MGIIISNYGDIFTQKDIIAINRCRLYLQVICVSDVASGDGREITKKAFLGLLPIEFVEMALTGESI